MPVPGSRRCARAVHERAAAGNTIPFHVDGHDDLVRQARLLVAMKNVPEQVRSSVRAVIAHEAQARDRQGRVLALAAEAGRLLDSHRRLAAQDTARPAAELAGYPAWRERWLKARRQWRAMLRRPDLWQPHLDRYAGDVNERLDRCERLAATDAAWARFVAAHHRGSRAGAGAGADSLRHGGLVRPCHTGKGASIAR